MPFIEDLEHTSLFSCFTNKQLEFLEQSIHTSTLKKKNNLFDQGSKADYFYFLQTGIIKLEHISSSGESRIIEIIRDGEFFAEALMFLQQPNYPVSAIAAKDCQIIAINAQKYLELLNSTENASLLLLGNLSKRLHQLIGDMNALTLNSAESRVASYISNCMSQKQNTFRLELPKQIIASRLSMKPETLSRALHHLQDIEVIQLTNKELTILNKSKLNEIATQNM